jgi:outer membrane protein assembly factor BamB
MSGEGVVYCFSAKDGRILWQKDTFGELGGRQIGWSVAESLLVDGDHVICTPGGTTATLVALNARSGQTVWRTNADSKSAYCSPVLVNHNGRKIILTMVEDGALAVDAKDGRQLWLYRHRNKYAVHAATPVYYKGRVVISSGYGYGTECLEMNKSGTSVRRVWSNKELANHHGGIIGIGSAVVGTGERGLVCIDIPTGRVNWRAHGVGKASLVYADGLLFMYGEKRGEVALADVTPEKFGGLTGDFRVTEGTKQNWAHPVVANGVLYIRHGDTLIAYKVSE